MAQRDWKKAKKIWKQQQKLHRYTMYHPDRVKKTLMQALYYDNRTRRIVKALYDGVRARFGSLLHALIGSEFMLSLVELANTKTLLPEEDGDFGDPIQTTLVITLALGFHVEPETLAVRWPESNARKYFEALYYDAVVSYKQKVVKLTGLEYEDAADPAFLPRGTPEVFTRRSMINFVNTVYSSALSTGMTYNVEIFKRGVFKQVPVWFNTILASMADWGAPPTEAPAEPLREEEGPPLARIQAVVETTAQLTREACDAEKRAIEATYKEAMASIKGHLFESRTENAAVKAAVGDARHELEDVRQKLQQCTDRLEAMGDTDAPHEAIQAQAEVGDVAGQLTKVFDRVDEADKADQNAQAVVTSVQALADENAGNATQSFLNDIASGGLKEKLKHVDTQDKGAIQDALVNVFTRALAQRRHVIAGGEEEEEEEETAEWEDDTIAGAISASPRPQRRSTSFRRDRRRPKALSPTRAAFGDIYNQLK